MVLIEILDRTEKLYIKRQIDNIVYQVIVTDLGDLTLFRVK